MTSKQRAYLRALSNKIDAIFQIGKNGLTPVFITQIDHALESRELIKISVLETAPEDNYSLAQDLAMKTNSVLVQLMGNKVTLYRARKKDPKIELPK